MDAKKLFIEVLEEEKRSIRRTTERLEGEKEGIEKIEVALEKKGGEEVDALIKAILKEGMRGDTWVI